MRAIVSIAVLLAAAVPALAIPTPVPEPDTLPLLAIGAVGLALVAMRRKKK